MKNKISRHIMPLVMLCLLLFTIIISVSVGSAGISTMDSLKLIIKKFPIIGRLVDTSDIKSVYEMIIYNMRLPRVLLAGLTGGGLALTGAVFQGVFRNPLAEPYILGVSSGAACGAAIAMLTGITINFVGLSVTGIFAFIGALLTIILVYKIANVNGRLPAVNLLLTGAAISSMLSAVITLIMALDRSGIEKVFMWTMGSFSSATWEKAAYLFIFEVLCGGVLLFYGKELNLLSMGEEAAESMGVDTVKLKKIVVVCASLLVAAAVSVSGIIGFAGLIVPHCIKMLAGPDHKRVLPYSVLGGAIFMIFCDTIARVIIAPSELPVGVISSILGAPYFIMLIYKNKNSR